MTKHQDDEEFREAVADREPTPDEECAADEAADDVDLDTIAEEYEHMTDLGANVRGEGQIEPDTSSAERDTLD